jgi:hypothetical protein
VTTRANDNRVAAALALLEHFAATSFLTSG